MLGPKLKCSENCAPSQSRMCLEDFVNRLAGRKLFQDTFDRDASASNYWPTHHHSRVAFDNRIHFPTPRLP